MAHADHPVALPQLPLGCTMVFLAVAFASSAAHAQAFVETDIGGAPLGLLETPTLTPGACYEIQTGEVSRSTGADPIMSIRTGQSDLDSTIAGADACITPGGSNLIEPACARFCVNAAQFPTARPFSIWVRAYLASYRGTADVRIQQTSGLTDVPEAGSCDGGAAVQHGCWTTLASSLSFGGISRKGAFGSPIQMETTEQPGIQGGTGLTSSHIIVFAGDNDQITLNWNIAPSEHPALLGSGYPGSHRRDILYTAQYSGPRPSLVPGGAVYTVIAAPYYGTGPFRLMQNDFVIVGVVGVGTDNDLDELGAALEIALKSCDSTATPAEATLTCASLPSCTAFPTSAACKQSLRDSDQDGIRDEIETYGVQLYDAAGTKVDGGWMARYGANPARYDLFFEVDYKGDIPNPAPPPTLGGCTGGPNPGEAFGQAEADAMAAQFADTTAALFPNRSGVAGIAAHFDIGPGPTSSPTVPTSTTGGNWGGSSCWQDNPLCTTNADCGPGTCCVGTTACGTVLPGTCITTDWRSVSMSRPRRWLFRQALAYQKSITGGLTGSGALVGFSGSASGLVHEGGHQGCLDHEGPNNAGMNSGVSPLVPGNDGVIIGNYRANFVTRMNYAFNYQGGADLLTPDPLPATRVSFSRGALPPLRPLALSEACPLGSANAYDLVDNYITAFRGRVSYTPPCPWIDFNEDGVYEPAGTTVEGRIGDGQVRLGREIVGPFEFLAEGGPEVVEVDSTMFRIRVAGVVNAGAINPVLQRSSKTTFACNEAAAGGVGDRFPPCPFVDTAVTTMATGADVPVAVAADTGTVGGARRAIVVYRTRMGGLSHGTLSSAGVWTVVGPIPSVPALPFLASGAGFASVARIGGTQNMLLTYRTQVAGAPGPVVEQVFNATSGTWSGPTTVIAFGALASPATTTLENTSLGANGVLMVSPRNNAGTLTWDFWQRTSISSTSLPATWTLVRSLPQAADGTWGRPVIEVRPFRIGAATVDRVILSWRSTANRLETWVRTSPRGSLLGVWTTARTFVDFGNGGKYPSPYATEMSFDTRSSVSMKGLRGVWGEVMDCLAPNAAPCPTASSCLLIAGGSGGTTNPVAACISNDGLVQGRERRTPGADGVQPMTVPDFNEWSMLRHCYCATLRDEGSGTATGGPWAPTAYRETRASCVIAPVYAR